MGTQQGKRMVYYGFDRSLHLQCDELTSHSTHSERDGGVRTRTQEALISQLFVSARPLFSHCLEFVIKSGVCGFPKSLGYLLTANTSWAGTPYMSRLEWRT